MKSLEQEMTVTGSYLAEFEEDANRNPISDTGTPWMTTRWQGQSISDAGLRCMIEELTTELDRRRGIDLGFIKPTAYDPSGRWQVGAFREHEKGLLHEIA